MSFWTDIRDTVTAPFRAVGGLVGDILSGKNVFESATTFAGRGLAVYQAPASFIVDKTPIKGVLKNEMVDKLTLGVTGNLADRSAFLRSITEDRHDATFSELKNFGIQSAVDAGKVTAVATGFGGGALTGVGSGVGSLSGGLSAFGAAKTLESAIEKGDFLSAGANFFSSGFGADLGLGDEFGFDAAGFFQDAGAIADATKNAYAQAAKNQAPQTRGSPLTTSSGWGGGVGLASENQSGLGGVLILAGLGVALVIAAKKKSG